MRECLAFRVPMIVHDGLFLFTAQDDARGRGHMENIYYPAYLKPAVSKRLGNLQFVKRKAKKAFLVKEIYFLYR